MNRISRFYRISAPAPAREMDEAARDKYYRRLRMQAFIAATLGYSLYYVCRTSLNVMKKPILDSGSLDASQLGVIGSALLFAYAIGKFVNGFIADYCNIKRFMATGLIVSAAANMLMGVLGLMHSVIPTAVIFIAFAVMWGLNGWSQSMGAAPAIISLSRWYPLKERGTYYGFFSASHNLGEFFSFLFVGSIVTFAGWQAGFFGSAIAGAIGVVVILLMLHDTPESKGLPPVEALAHEKPAASADKSVKEIQKQVLRTPAVWILAAASAFMYISRYAINGWGVLFLQEAKGFSDVEAISVVSINALLGILGTVLSGWFSDKLFKGDRKVPALIFGVLNAAALALFFYGGINEAMFDVSLDNTITALKKGKFMQAIYRLIGSKTGKHKVKTLKGDAKKEYEAIPDTERLTKRDIEQGTTTISNLGSLYREQSGAAALLEIIPPQVTAFGVGAVQDKPMVITDSFGNKSIEARKVLPICIAFDHRALDFGDIVPFLKRLDDIFENPKVIHTWKSSEKNNKVVRLDA